MARSRPTLDARDPHATGVGIRSMLSALVALGLTACVPIGGAPRTAEAAGGPFAPAPTVVAATAPPSGRVSSEISRLATYPHHPGAGLRRAFLLQEQGDWDGAESVLNGLLFGDVQHGPEIDAVSRYLRGRGYAHAGDRERAEDEWRRALANAIDPDLRRRVEAEGVNVDRGDAAPRAGIAAETPEVLSRSTWTAASAKTRSMRRMGGVRRITVHHSATLVSSRSQSAAIGAIRGIQRHHQKENGWGDIGYHFLIDPAGRVWAGRSLEWQGAHAGDNARNAANIGICLLGNFVRDAQGAPPPAQLQALERLVGGLCSSYRIDPRDVLTHQELKTTDCPGPYVQLAVERIRDRLAGRLWAADPAPR